MTAPKSVAAIGVAHQCPAPVSANVTVRIARVANTEGVEDDRQDLQGRCRLSPRRRWAGGLIGSNRVPSRTTTFGAEV